MIAFLTGSFARKTPSYVHIDVHGVGYEVHISLNTYSRIQDLESGTLHTHLLVREDAHLLFGFADEAEKALFLQLVAVSGIGANTARVMLSYMKPDELSRAIVSWWNCGTNWPNNPLALKQIFLPGKAILYNAMR